VPRVAPRSPDAPQVKLLGNPANACDPGTPDVIHDGLQVPCPLSGGGLEFGHGFRVAYLFALERSGTVGVAKALDVRPSALASANNSLLCGGQGVLGALPIRPVSSSATAATCVRRKPAHGAWGDRRQITEHEVHTARYQRPKEVHVAGEPVKFRKDQLGADSLCVGQRGCQLGTVGAPAAIPSDSLNSPAASSGAWD